MASDLGSVNREAVHDLFNQFEPIVSGGFHTLIFDDERIVGNMRIQSSSEHTDHLLVHLLVIGNSLRKAVTCTSNTLDQRGASARSNTKRKYSRRTLASIDLVVDELEKLILCPNFAICEKEDFKVHVPVSLLEGGLQRLVHLGATVVGREGLYMLNCIIKSFLDIGLRTLPKEGETRPKAADVELDPDRHGFEEDLQGGFEVGDLIGHTSTTITNENNLWFFGRKLKLGHQSCHDCTLVWQIRMGLEDG
ncbi:hypothetical protein HG531_009441 [Fusarium graminearum]|nr:hypothetical protein HG531_009441 [Fusarium graminearum]